MSDTEVYDNPLVRRYAGPEMAKLWGPQTKFRTWRRLWVALAEAQQELGLLADDGITPRISDRQLQELRAHVDDIDFEQAARSYRSLAQIKPQYAMGWFNLAVSLERLSAWDEASEAFHKASTLDANHTDAHLGLGICHLRMEDPKSALFSFERCLELAPEHEDALFGKAASLQSLGHGPEASALYQKILERNPESEESLSNLVLIGLTKEDFDMVREYSERLLEMRPESTVALEGMSAWACAAGDHALTAKFCTLLV